MSDHVEKIMVDGIEYLKNIYQSDGLSGLLLTILVGGLVMGGMGFLFYAAASVNPANKKKENNDTNTKDDV
jgi:hypothetical protein